MQECMFDGPIVNNIPGISFAIQEVERITKIDMEHKSVIDLCLSAIEELGELARELKIENKIFGNTNKTSGEGSQMESVDLLITAIAMYFACGGKTTSLSDKILQKIRKWETHQKSGLQ